MSWQTSPAPSYPQPQQYYRINMTALTWGEIRGSSGNIVTFLVCVPILAFCKLFRIPLGGSERFPREVSFQTPEPATLAQRSQHVAHVLQAMQSLGFEHFTTFRVPEMPYDSLVFATLNRAENAYACAYHVITPVGTKVFYDFVTRLRDGGGLTSTSSREGVAVLEPEKFRRQALHGASPEELWRAHQAKLAELAPLAGGVAGPVSADDFVEAWRRHIREVADFQAERGVYLPAGVGQ
ncbi:MAG: hypothetical protein ACE5R4_03495 [Armatimonadota bacterium]